MFYRKNVGPRERWLRAVAGGSIAVCSLIFIGTTPLGLLVACAGACTAMTGAVGFCPACAVAGRKPLAGPG
jgi:hypothetical protein